jgi:hypothetical protein
VERTHRARERAFPTFDFGAFAVKADSNSRTNGEFLLPAFDLLGFNVQSLPRITVALFPHISFGYHVRCEANFAPVGKL